VSDLYIPGTRVWDEEVVRNSFFLLEAEKVLKIKPSINMPTDVVAWAFEKKWHLLGTLGVQNVEG
jgi:hypothetical protein